MSTAESIIIFLVVTLIFFGLPLAIFFRWSTKRRNTITILEDLEIKSGETYDVFQTNEGSYLRISDKGLEAVEKGIVLNIPFDQILSVRVSTGRDGSSLVMKLNGSYYESMTEQHRTLPEGPKIGALLKALYMPVGRNAGQITYHKSRGLIDIALPMELDSMKYKSVEKYISKNLI